MATVIKTVSLPLIDYQSAKVNGISVSRATQAGIRLLLYEMGLAELPQEWHISQKMRNIEAQSEALRARIARLKVDSDVAIQ